ncbi:MAG: hypothetical protein ACR2H3_14790 [Acidimicrobiales bacterium]
MSIGDILDGAFKLFKANAKTVIVIVASITLPVQLLVNFLARDAFATGTNSFGSTTTTDVSSIVGALVATGIGLLVTPFIAGAVSRVVAASYLGHDIGPGAALKIALGRFGALLGSFILVHLAEFSGLIACLIGVVVTGPMFMALFVMTAPAIVVEELGPIEGMRRSWRLVRPRFWPVLGTALLAGLIAWFISNMLGGIPAFVVALANPWWGWIMLAVVSVLASLITEPIVAIVATLLYFDARIRHEGFDLELMAADLRRG